MIIIGFTHRPTIARRKIWCFNWMHRNTDRSSWADSCRHTYVSGSQIPMRFNQTEIHCTVSAGLSSLHNAALIVLSQKKTDRETRRCQAICRVSCLEQKRPWLLVLSQIQRQVLRSFCSCRSFVDSRVDNRVSSWENTQASSRLISQQLACSLLWTRVLAWKICKVASIYTLTVLCW